MAKKPQPNPRNGFYWIIITLSAGGSYKAYEYITAETGSAKTGAVMGIVLFLCLLAAFEYLVEGLK